MSVTSNAFVADTHTTTEPDPFSWSRYILRVAFAAALYFLAGRVGLWVPFTSGNVSPVWPASGVAITAILLWGFEIWPGVALGAFLVNFFSPIPMIAALGLAAGNAAGGLLGAYLIRRAEVRFSFSRLRDALGLVGAAVLSPMVAASVGTQSFPFRICLRGPASARHGESGGWGTPWVC